MSSPTPSILLKDIRKAYGATVALDGVTLELKPGEVHALLGENGAGKTTLMKTLFGLTQPDTGHIEVDGVTTAIASPRDARSAGIGMVTQHFSLVKTMTVAENLALAEAGLLRVDLAKARRIAEDAAARYGLEVPADAVVAGLPVALQQRVEILKALAAGCRYLILDEPTAVLTPQETDELLRVIRGFADNGVGVVFITHKLREVLALADTIEVLRGGKQVGTTTPAETDQAGLAQMMVGRGVLLQVDKSPAEPQKVVLDAVRLSANDDLGLPSVREVTLQVRAGEIVGIAGVEGNGQRELVQAITGLRRCTADTLTVDGQSILNKAPGKIHDMGVGHVPEDREADGLVGAYSVADNLVLDRFDEPEFASRGVRKKGAVNALATELVARFDVRTPGISTTVQSLSGGNKQKVVIARELAADPVLLVAAQPTRGVDVGSIEFIHSQIVAARDRGAAVLLVSAELDEILGLSDRIAVMYDGRLVDVIDAADADRSRIGRLMAGGEG